MISCANPIPGSKSPPSPPSSPIWSKQPTYCSYRNSLIYQNEDKNRLFICPQRVNPRTISLMNVDYGWEGSKVTFIDPLDQRLLLAKRIQCKIFPTKETWIVKLIRGKKVILSKLDLQPLTKEERREKLVIVLSSCFIRQAEEGGGQPALRNLCRACSVCVQYNWYKFFLTEAFVPPQFVAAGLAVVGGRGVMAPRSPIHPPLPHMPQVKIRGNHKDGQGGREL